jgi:hypothetical protein
VSTPALTAAPHESLEAIQRRIDPPHFHAGVEFRETASAGEMADAPAPLDEGRESAGEGDEAATLWSHMRTQAHQLAGALRRRQEELDRREANLHAQAEQLEQETRGARLWWQDQLEELARREAELARQAEELRCREELVEKADDECPTYNVEYPTSNDSMPDALGSTLDVDGSTLDVGESAPTDADDASRAAAGMAELESRREALLRGEALLAEELSAAGQQRAELEAAAATHRQQAQAAQAEAAEERRRATEELEHKRLAIAREMDRLEARRGELEHLRDELRAAQRETLEVRLATEELWSQLSGAVPAASLTRAIGRIRQRLTDQYRLAASDLEDQKRELESLRGRLQQHHDRLARRQQDLQQWFERRQAELHEQTERLAAREEELSQERSAIDALRQHWHLDRCRLHGELRELLAGPPAGQIG